MMFIKMNNRIWLPHFIILYSIFESWYKNESQTHKTSTGCCVIITLCGYSDRK